MNKLTATIAVLLIPGTAAAHTDHFSGGDFGLLHLLTDPFHIGLTAAVALLFVVARRTIRRRRVTSRNAR